MLRHPPIAQLLGSTAGLSGKGNFKQKTHSPEVRAWLGKVRDFSIQGIRALQRIGTVLYAWRENDRPQLNQVKVQMADSLGVVWPHQGQVGVA